jgi:hypothetical protein
MFINDLACGLKKKTAIGLPNVIVHITLQDSTRDTEA